MQVKRQLDAHRSAVEKELKIMIMERDEIERIVKNAQFGEEVTVHVRLADMLKKGIPVPINSAKLKVVLHETFILNLELTKEQIENCNDKYILFSTDESKQYKQELIVSQNYKVIDEKYCLEFEDLKNELNYSLVLKPANSEEEIYFFKNISKKELLKEE